VTAADAGAYTVIVGNTFGSVTSQPATLTLSGTAPPPVITDGLVAYWNFDGNLLDTIKDFDGTAKGLLGLGPFEIERMDPADRVMGFGEQGIEPHRLERIAADYPVCLIHGDG